MNNSNTKKVSVFDRCAFKNCKNIKSENCKLFRFPQQGDKRFKIWLKNCGNTQILNWTPASIQKAGLCPDHFRDDDFIYQKYRLKLHLGRNPIPYDPANDTHEDSEVEYEPIVEEITVEELSVEEDDSDIDEKRFITTTPETKSKDYMNIIKNIVEKDHRRPNVNKMNMSTEQTSMKTTKPTTDKSHFNTTVNQSSMTEFISDKITTTTQTVDEFIPRRTVMTQTVSMDEFPSTTLLQHSNGQLIGSATITQTDVTGLFLLSTSTPLNAKSIFTQREIVDEATTQTDATKVLLASNSMPINEKRCSPKKEFVDDAIATTNASTIMGSNLEITENQKCHFWEKILVDKATMATDANNTEEHSGMTMTTPQHTCSSKTDFINDTSTKTQAMVVEEFIPGSTVSRQIYYPPFNNETTAQIIEEFTPNELATQFYYASRAELLREVMKACKSISNDTLPSKMMTMPSKREIRNALTMTQTTTLEEFPSKPVPTHQKFNHFTKEPSNHIGRPKIVSIEKLPSRTSAAYQKCYTPGGLMSDFEDNLTEDLKWLDNEKILPLLNSRIDLNENDLGENVVLDMSPKLQKLKKQIKNLQKRKLKLKKLVQKWRFRQKRTRDILRRYKLKIDGSKHICNHSVLQFLTGKECDEPFARTIIGLQLHKGLIGYTNEEKDFAKRLFSYSPNAYSWMRNAGLNLPSESCVKHWVFQSQYRPSLKLSLQFADESAFPSLL